VSQKRPNCSNYCWDTTYVNSINTTSPTTLNGCDMPAAIEPRQYSFAVRVAMPKKMVFTEIVFMPQVVNISRQYVELGGPGLWAHPRLSVEAENAEELHRNSAAARKQAGPKEANEVVELGYTNSKTSSMFSAG